MSIFASLGIVILAMLIMASLQLTPGVFALFYHYALGKFSKRKASDLTLFFIIGAEIVNALIFMSIYFLLGFFMFGNLGFKNDVFTYILVGITIALALASSFCYYRRGAGTQLFISRRYAKGMDHLASSTSSRTDAMLLGALAGSYELVFSLPLFIIIATIALELTMARQPSNLITIAFVLAPLIPLFIIRWQYQSGHNLADIIRLRIKNKTFTKILLTLSFLFIAILMILFKVVS